MGGPSPLPADVLNRISARPSARVQILQGPLQGVGSDPHLCLQSRGGTNPPHLESARSRPQRCRLWHRIGACPGSTGAPSCATSLSSTTLPGVVVVSHRAIILSATSHLRTHLQTQPACQVLPARVFSSFSSSRGCHCEHLLAIPTCHAQPRTGLSPHAAPPQPGRPSHGLSASTSLLLLVVRALEVNGLRTEFLVALTLLVIRAHQGPRRCRRCARQSSKSPLPTLRSSQSHLPTHFSSVALGMMCR
mmetsp:Transcript_97630/g.314611  ORF Transcript_97630/g.314611 Transcript_97630/m.314611 type:complete len:248 (-) Transcript_97630:282-1025(-)